MEWGGLFILGAIALVFGSILVFAVVVFWIDSRLYRSQGNKDKIEGKSKLSGRVPGQL